jgi:hypothetical protein
VLDVVRARDHRAIFVVVGEEREGLARLKVESSVVGSPLLLCVSGPRMKRKMLLLEQSIRLVRFWLRLRLEPETSNQIRVLTDSCTPSRFCSRI